MAEKLTPAERETLLALRDGPRCFYTLSDECRMVLPTLHHDRGLVESDGPEHEMVYRLTPAGRAALTGEPEPTDELARLRAENERLRAALEAIAKDAPTTKPEWGAEGKGDEIESNGYDIAHWHFAEIARAALALAADLQRRFRPSDEWLLKMAEAEGGKEVSVGGLAVDLGMYKAQPEPAADTIDPAAWAALLRVSGAYDDNPGQFNIWRFLGKWEVLLVPRHRNPCRAVADNINAAIRAAVAQAEGREGAS